MVEENTIAGEQTIAFAVICGCPVCIQFRTPVRATRTERGGFRLWSFDGFPEHFAARSLIELGLDSCFSYGFQQAYRAQCGYIAGVFRNLKAHQNMALSAEIIDFVGLKAIEKSDQTCRIGKISEMQ